MIEQFYLTTDETIIDQSGPGSNGSKGYSVFPKAPGIRFGCFFVFYGISIFVGY